jgi:hypothetical protein
LDIRVPGSNGKVYICHAPPGNPTNTSTLAVSTNAVPTHLSSHSTDRLGTCEQSCNNSNAKMIAGKPAIGDEIKVYPNPNNGTFTLELPYVSDKALLSVTDVSGKSIMKKIITDSDGNRVKMNLGDVARGVYFVELVMGNQYFRTKLIVQ